jgi:hypothetical protein
MTEGLNGIIAGLERQKTAIERALAALRDVDGGESTPRAEVSVTPATRKGRMTPEGRKRLSAALRKRWALRKAADAAPVVSAQQPIRRKGGMTEDGRRRLAEAMKRRWAVKRAGAAVKKGARKKRAVRKAP